jgi:hypothetical protein
MRSDMRSTIPFRQQHLEPTATAPDSHSSSSSPFTILYHPFTHSPPTTVLFFISIINNEPF